MAINRSPKTPPNLTSKNEIITPRTTQRNRRKNLFVAFSNKLEEASAIIDQLTVEIHSTKKEILEGRILSQTEIDRLDQLIRGVENYRRQWIMVMLIHYPAEKVAKMLGLTPGRISQIKTEELKSRSVTLKGTQIGQKNTAVRRAN